MKIFDLVSSNKLKKLNQNYSSSVKNKNDPSMEEFMFFCEISTSLKLNLIEQVKQFYFLTITINLSTTSL
jgi:hypothetical protein